MLKDNRRRKFLKIVKSEIQFVSMLIRDTLGRNRRVDAVTVKEQDGCVVFEIQCEWEEVSILFAGVAPALDQALVLNKNNFVKKYEQAINKRLQRR